MSKYYGCYSDEDLNDWQRLPYVEEVLTSSAMGAWLMRRDERRNNLSDIEKIKNVIKKIELNVVLKRIRSEIEDIIKREYSSDPCYAWIKIVDGEKCLKIIDKYIGETE